jgi:hypothetical protein
MYVGWAKPIKAGRGEDKYSEEVSTRGHQRTEERKQNRLHSLFSSSVVLSVPEFRRSILPHAGNHTGKGASVTKQNERDLTCHN